MRLPHFRALSWFRFDVDIQYSYTMKFLNEFGYIFGRFTSSFLLLLQYKVVNNTSLTLIFSQNTSHGVENFSTNRIPFQAKVIKGKNVYRVFISSEIHTKIGTIQRRLAWPLRKDDTQNREAFLFF